MRYLQVTSLLILSIVALFPLSQSTLVYASPLDEETVRIIVVPPFSESQREIGLMGCNIIHVLTDGLAVACPRSIATYLLRIGVAVEDKILRIFDLESDVYINADDSWSLGYNGSGVKVAVLDTGVDAFHPELADSIFATDNFAPGQELDDIGHGTHVMGIVTANGGNQITGGTSRGFADPNEATGAAHQAMILSGRVCARRGCFTSDIERGIEWAVLQGARVINLSLGGGNFGTHCDGDRLAGKANLAVEQGVVVVASSGNDAAGVSSPACGSGVIAVGAVYQRDIGRRDWSPTCIDETTARDQIVCFSNSGPALDLVAPGAGVLSTYSCVAAGDCSRVWYAWGSGTSQASPHVAAVAALVLSVNPSLTPAEVKNILESTARDLGPPGRDDVYGWGLVDPLAAVAAAGAQVNDIAVTQLSPEKSVTYSQVANPLRVDATVQNLGVAAQSVTVSLFANAIPVATQTISLPTGTSQTITFQWDTTTTILGSYALSASVEAVLGELNTGNNQLQDGMVQVNFPGDVNGDGTVNIIDLVTVGLAFQSTPTSPNWDPTADINNDQLVNIVDLVIAGTAFGSSG